MRISDWSSDVCSSDLLRARDGFVHRRVKFDVDELADVIAPAMRRSFARPMLHHAGGNVAGHADVEELVTAIGEDVDERLAHHRTLTRIVIQAKAGISPFRAFKAARADPRPSTGGGGQG